MKKKIIFWGIGIIGIILVLIGVSSRKNNEQKHEIEKSFNYYLENTEIKCVGNRDDIIDKKGEYQFFFSELSPIAKKGDNYYIINDGKFYVYYNNKIKLLNNIKYLDGQCEIYDDTIQFYDNHVYTIGIKKLDSNVYIYLYQIDLKGQNIKCIMQLAGIPDEDFYLKYIIHKGRIYYSISYYSDEIDIAFLLMKNLNTSEKPICLDSEEGKIAKFMRIRAYGDKLYYQKMSLKSEEKSDYNGGTYVYDINEKKCENILDHYVRDYSIAGENIYYQKDDWIVRKNSEKIYQICELSGLFTISFDGKNIYIDNEYDIVVNSKNIADRKIFKYDLKGDWQETIFIETSGQCFFGDEKLLFLYADNNTKILEAFELYALNKKMTSNDREAWNKITIDE